METGWYWFAAQHAQGVKTFHKNTERAGWVKEMKDGRFVTRLAPGLPNDQDIECPSLEAAKAVLVLLGPRE